MLKSWQPRSLQQRNLYNKNMKEINKTKNKYDCNKQGEGEGSL